MESSNPLRHSKRLQGYSPYYSPPSMTPNDDDAPYIHIQCVDPEPITDSSGFHDHQRLDYTNQNQLNLFAYRSAASDSGSECHSPSSPSSSSSSSPYLGGQSPDPSFRNFNADADQLSLEYHSPSLGFYTAQQPSEFSMSGLSISNFPENIAAPSPQQTNPIYGHPYMGFPLHSTSMPDILDTPSEEHLNNFGMLQPGLRRIASTSSAPSFQPIIRTEMIDEQDFSFRPEFVPDDQGIPPLPTSTSPLPRSSSPDHAIMSLIQDLIDQEPVDGEHMRYDIQELLDTYHIPTSDHHSRFLKAPKNTVASDAGRKASEKRRRHASKFRCMIRGCPSSFTRKLGLKNHLKSHFGLADQLCRHCKAMLPNSLARHEKKCKKNPKREPPSKKTQDNPPMPM